jgi:Tetratricopeptide repeat
MDTLGRALLLQGRYAEAEQEYRQLLDVERRVLGPDHPQTLAAMDVLAVVIEDQDRFAEAEQLFRETLAADQRVLGFQHLQTADVMDGLEKVSCSFLPASVAASKPPNAVINGFGVELKRSETENPQPIASSSACAPFREAIELGLSQGRDATAIWQDLVSESGFDGGYQTVKRYVRKLRGNQPLPELPDPRLLDALLIVALSRAGFRLRDSSRSSGASPRTQPPPNQTRARHL